MPPSLSVSIVVYHPDQDRLGSTLASLRSALGVAHAARSLAGATLTIIDNGTEDEAALDALIAHACGEPPWLRTRVLRGQGNIGYGRAHNLALGRASETYHLVLNPDVVLEDRALLEAIRYLEAHPDVGMLTPYVENERGEREFLCKREPSILVLALRGFGPAWLRRRFRDLLDWYEMRDLVEDRPSVGIPIASGCFMFGRASALRSIGGFSPAFFLYFEDFDLSLRLRAVAPIAFVPDVRIAHHGGYAARKGWKHRWLFIRSAVTFFRRQGWKVR